MEKREKILIVLMALAALYGGYTFLTFNSGERTPKEESGDLTAFVADISSKIGKSHLSEVEVYTIGKAAEPWKEAAFLNTMLAGAEENKNRNTGMTMKEGDEAAAFVYSGYIQIAGLRLAIINGVEYEAGEKLEEAEGYVLRKILSTRVILYNGNSEESYPLNGGK